MSEQTNNKSRRTLHEALNSKHLRHIAISVGIFLGALP